MTKPCRHKEREATGAGTQRGRYRRSSASEHFPSSSLSELVIVIDPALSALVQPFHTRTDALLPCLTSKNMTTESGIQLCGSVVAPERHLTTTRNSSEVIERERGTRANKAGAEQKILMPTTPHVWNAKKNSPIPYIISTGAPSAYVERFTLEIVTNYTYGFSRMLCVTRYLLEIDPADRNLPPTAPSRNDEKKRGAQEFTSTEGKS